MADLSFWGTAAVALIPMCGVVGGFVAQTLIAGRNVYINSITSERSKWLEKLRANLLAYYSLSLSVVHRERTSGEVTDAEAKRQLAKERFADLQKLEELASLLRLQLNPNGAIDGNVVRLIEALQAQQDRESADLSALRERLISHSQWLLKAEWKKVKWEAGSLHYRYSHKDDEATLLAGYRNWSLRQRSLERVVSIKASSPSWTDAGTLRASCPKVPGRSQPSPDDVYAWTCIRRGTTRAEATSCRSTPCPRNLEVLLRATRCLDSAGGGRPLAPLQDARTAEKEFLA